MRLLSDSKALMPFSAFPEMTFLAPAVVPPIVVASLESSEHHSYHWDIVRSRGVRSNIITKNLLILSPLKCTFTPSPTLPEMRLPSPVPDPPTAFPVEPLEMRTPLPPFTTFVPEEVSVINPYPPCLYQSGCPGCERQWSDQSQCRRVRFR